MNFSAASSTSPSSSPLLTENGESVILSCLTIGLFPDPSSAGDALTLVSISSAFRSSELMQMSSMSSKHGDARSGVGMEWCFLWCFLWMEKRESGFGEVLLQLNSCSPEGSWCGWLVKVAEAELWWWWNKSLCKAFPAILPRLITMLRSAKNLVLEMPFFNMKEYMTRNKLHTFFAVTGDWHDHFPKVTKRSFSFSFSDIVLMAKTR